MSVTYMQSEKRLQVKPASAYKPPVVLETCLLLRPSVSAAGTPRFIRPRLRIDNWPTDSEVPRYGIIPASALSFTRLRRQHTGNCADCCCIGRYCVYSCRSSTVFCGWPRLSTGVRCGLTVAVCHSPPSAAKSGLDRPVQMSVWAGGDRGDCFSASMVFDSKITQPAHEKSRQLLLTGKPGHGISSSWETKRPPVTHRLCFGTGRLPWTPLVA